MVYPDHEGAINSIHNTRVAREQIENAEAFFRHGDYYSASQVLTQAIDICSWSSYLRELRAKCRIQLGDYSGAVSDFRSTTKLTADNTKGYYELAKLLYQLGQVQDSLKWVYKHTVFNMKCTALLSKNWQWLCNCREIRECLKLDPEHRDCFPFYKKIKKIAKFMEDAEAASESSDWETCIDKSNRVLKNEPTLDNVRLTALRLLCKCHTTNSEADEAVKNCRAALDIQRDPETLCDSAEAHLAGDMFDDGECVFCMLFFYLSGISWHAVFFLRRSCSVKFLSYHITIRIIFINSVRLFCRFHFLLLKN